MANSKNPTQAVMIPAFTEGERFEEPFANDESFEGSSLQTRRQWNLIS
jgi:hypothetical protein